MTLKFIVWLNKVLIRREIRGGFHFYIFFSENDKSSRRTDSSHFLQHP